MVAFRRPPVRGGRPIIAYLAGAALVVCPGVFRAAGLNDTGQTGCFATNGTAATCTDVVQDGRYGRDAASASGAVYKSGAGGTGFDFTKISNSGGIVGAGTALGDNAGNWACTLDNVTGLMWEIKSNSPTHLRYKNHSYTWYSTAPNNGGIPGTLGSDTCGGTLAAYNNQCNTANYVAAVNAAGLCGASDWRLPTVRELEGIRSFGTDDPAIDPAYFPNTDSNAQFYFTSTIYSLILDNAWAVYFRGGALGNQSATAASKSAIIAVRLVRGGS